MAGYRSRFGLNVVEADANLAAMVYRIRRNPQADQSVHLACDTLSIGLRIEPNPAVAPACFKLVEEQQGLGIDVDVDSAITFAILVGGDLGALNQMIKCGRPSNNRVL